MNLKIIIVMTMTTLSLLGSENYKCFIDSVVSLKTKEIRYFSKKEERKSIALKFAKQKAYVSMSNYNIAFILPYKGHGVVKNSIQADIYEEEGVQLEVIDISHPWSTGARLFTKANMYLIGSCKNK